MTMVDVFLILLVGSAAFAGYRQGLIAAACSLLGAVVFALLAVTITPSLVQGIDESLGRTAMSMAILIIGILIGELLGGWAGGVLSGLVTWSPARAVDRTLGMFGQAAAVLLIAWLIATPLAAAPIPALSSSIRNSAILGVVNRLVPDTADNVTEDLRELLNSTGFPDVLGPLDATPVVDVPAPDTTLSDNPAVAAAQPSVLKIRASAPSCGKAFSGSGFVIGPERVLTNAHVVGGSDQVSVEVGGSELDAEVVEYDDQLDLAVLLVPGLTEAPLTLDTQQLADGADAIALGYPNGGPFTASPARVRSTTDLSGPNIYNSDTVQREVFLLRADVQPGNSGGPLIDADGDVVGVVFGAAIDDPETAFAMTAAQVAPTIAAGLTDTTAADTQSCVLG